MRILPIGRFLAGAWLALSSPSSGRASLPFVVDDYGKAVAEARSRGVPIFVEAWAPW